MSVFMSIFLGLIQGITEFLPISSSGHLSIIQNLFGLEYAEGEHLLFDVLLHLGTLVSIILVYRKELKEMLSDTFAMLAGRMDSDSADAEGRLPTSVRTVFLILVGTLPLFLILPVHGLLESLFYKTGFIGFALLITGVLLFVSDRISEGRKTEKTMTVRDVLLIGLAQAIATIPGLSRAGTTFTVAKARGVRSRYALKFSFLLSIPAVLGSVLVSLISAIRNGVNWSAIPAYLIGFVVAAVTGYFAIGLVRRLLEKLQYGKFCYYCFGLGLLAILLSLIL